MQSALLIISLLGALPAQAGLYKYKDEKGTLHVVDSSDSIPEKYRENSEAVKKKGSGPAKGDVELQKEGNSLLVTVDFGKGVEATMILDTGASISLIAPSIAERINAPGMGGAQITTASGVVQVMVVKVAEVSVGGFAVNDIPMAVHKLPGGGRAQGLLGVDFLNHFRMKLDTQAGRLHLERK